MIVIDYGKVNPAVSVEVRRHQCPIRRPREYDFRLKCSIAIPEKYREKIATEPIVQHHQVELSIAIQISRHHRERTLAHVVLNVRLQGSITVAQKNRHCV